MINSKLHFSSESNNWPTPDDFFEKMNAEYGPFDVDVCASADNAKCEKFFTQEDDGLSRKWSGRCWMNPPYGRSIGRWMEKAFNSSRDGAVVCCLVPARTDTKWWHDYAMKGEITFVRGRLKFGGHKNPAPFPSAVVVFRTK